MNLATVSRLLIQVLVCIAGCRDLCLAQGSGWTVKALSTQGTNVTVTTAPPTGLSTMILESRQQLGAGTWIPRSVRRGESLTGINSFQLPLNATQEFFRLRGDGTEPFPDSFYAGQSVFPGRAVTQFGPDFMPRNQAGPASSWAVAKDRFLPYGIPLLKSGGPDVVRLRGESLYVLNPLRGLQEISFDSTTSPALMGTVPLSVASQIMFSLGRDYVAVVGQRICLPDQKAAGSALLTIDLRGAMPQVISEILIEGTIFASRWVNGFLCVVSSPVIERRGPSWVEWDAIGAVGSYDLSDPTRPVLRKEIRVDELPSSFAVSGSRLAVAGQSWGSTNKADLFEIGADGALTHTGDILPDNGHTGIAGLWFADDLLVLSTVRQSLNQWQPPFRSTLCLAAHHSR
jgi:hypothetical protein